MCALWIDTASAARLLGVSRRFVFRQAVAGRYGQTRREGISNEILISTRALELCACRLFSDEHIAAAVKGEDRLYRFPGEDRPEFAGLPLNHTPSIEAISAEVATTKHVNEEPDNEPEYP
jgi:hypothetical protein